MRKGDLSTDAVVILVIVAVAIMLVIGITQSGIEQIYNNAVPKAFN
jgi:hypothetical protein